MRWTLDWVPRGHLPLACLRVDGDDSELEWVEPRKDPVDSALVLHQRGDVRGLICYRATDRFLHLSLAWIHPGLRQRGLASWMGWTLITHYDPIRIGAHAVSLSGMSFMLTMRRWFPDKKFTVK